MIVWKDLLRLTLNLIRNQKDSLLIFYALKTLTHSLVGPRDSLTALFFPIQQSSKEQGVVPVGQPASKG